MSIASITSVSGLARVRQPQGEPYGRARISTGAGVLDTASPGWWAAGAECPVDLGRLDMASAHDCLLAQLYGPRVPPLRRGERGGGYAAGTTILGLSAAVAEACGFGGPDADLLTPGWRQLVAGRRAAA